MNLKSGLSGKTAQPLVVKEPEPEEGTVQVDLNVLAVQLSRSFVLTIQNVGKTALPVRHLATLLEV